ncbi:uncharacterized protein LOC131852793 [Achroia grisella]|uniref:uncharacterized protein LOC131852793 n=1 Tax=Achroia grisella TaxID=688607 RepID=UPI0027D2AEF0|nr:uncharacterized protein LOC131852793 [Achroia grisella]
MPLLELKVIIFSLLIIQFCVNSISNSCRDVRTMETKNIFGHIPKRLKSDNNISNNADSMDSINKYNIPTVAALKENSKKKWQVGRVSRKQYEIINMLWRRTKIFIDMDSTTTLNKVTKNMFTNKNTFKISRRNPLTFSFMRPKSSTESYIEFYYLEDNNESLKYWDIRLKDKHLNASKYQSKTSSKHPDINKQPLSRYPLVAINFNNPNYKSTYAALPFKITLKQEKPRIDYLPFLHIKRLKKIPTLNDVNRNVYTNVKQHLKKKEVSDDFVMCPYTTETPSTNKNIPFSQVSKNTTVLPKTLSTVYDKIKFFEIYDGNTRSRNLTYNYDEINEIDNVAKDYILNNNNKVLLEHVDHGIGHHSDSHVNRYVKKHITENTFKNLMETPMHTSSSAQTKPTRLTKTMEKRKVESLKWSKVQQNNEHKLCNKSQIAKCHANVFFNFSKRALWSEHPFAAVYIYEPSKIHCDAAAISPHWLVAAASCLSRHHTMEPTTASRSAFVTYCGDNWRQPVRIAYVKYTVVHPRYHHKDELRRNNYNIGVIKVVSRMSSSCSRWSPIPLMSHQYTTDQDGTMAYAVGWGLDRYDTRHTPTVLPKWPLMMYQGLIYSDSCPGSNTYIKSKRKHGIEGVKNLYCLSLPPYLGEEYDPVHGSLLLLGGKLIALYLQEERRPWGEQSAIYTAIWSLLPWILDVAREPEDIDVFTAGI